MTTPLDTVRRFYAALGCGDVPAIFSILDAQVEWTEAERFPYYDGTWRGPQAVVDNLLIPIARDWDGFSATAIDFVAQDNRVVALGRYSGSYKRTGRSMTAAFAHVWAVRDGKIVSLVQHTDTAKVLEAMESSDTIASGSGIRAMLNEFVIAKSHDVVEYDGYYYFKRADVRMEWLKPADITESDRACPHGVRFYDVVIGGTRHPRVAWSYEAPRAPLHHLAARMGFWKDVKVH